MHIPDSIPDAVRDDGYAVMEGFLDADELAAAREGVFEVFPTPEDYFADPEPFEFMVTHQFGPAPSDSPAIVTRSESPPTRDPGMPTNRGDRSARCR